MVAASGSSTLPDVSDYHQEPPIPTAKQVIDTPLSERDFGEIIARWQPDTWQDDVATVMNQFIGALVNRSQAPDPEAAAILEENLWDLV